MPRILLAATAVLLTAACTTLDLDDVWSKSGATPLELTHDDWQCRRRVYQDAPRTVDVYVGGVADAVRVWRDEDLRDGEYSACMQARGYARTQK